MNGSNAITYCGPAPTLAELGARWNFDPWLLLAFAPRPLYVEHFVAPLAFGLTPLDDQRLAGLIMWVPALAPYFAAAGWIARRRWAAAARVTA